MVNIDSVGSEVDRARRFSFFCNRKKLVECLLVPGHNIFYFPVKGTFINQMEGTGSAKL